MELVVNVGLLLYTMCVWLLMLGCSYILCVQMLVNIGLLLHIVCGVVVNMWLHAGTVDIIGMFYALYVGPVVTVGLLLYRVCVVERLLLCTVCEDGI